MGEVYRAHDLTLERDVALKVITESHVLDADRRTRFEREARILASLNHPYIGAIYGIEEMEGVRALVLELVPGPTIADRLRGGALSPHEALSIAKQIAEALEAAHGQGVVHRDLKPANVKITPAGVVKVLDFGLAKEHRLDSEITVAGTEAGLMLGTPAYMSPEQTRGALVDNRADNWAFGCVLYEMLTGRSAFGRPTIADTLIAVCEREPDWSHLPGTVPANVRRLLERCLTKDPRRRLHHIADARVELEDALMPRPSPGAAQDALQIETNRRRRVWSAVGMTGAAGMLVVIAWVVLMELPPATPPRL